jgi:hypothetical protein
LHNCRTILLVPIASSYSEQTTFLRINHHDGNSYKDVGR